MGYKLVIAEKAMLAQDIANAIIGKGSGSAKLPRSGNGYKVCAANGHLLRLVEPFEVDDKYRKWDLDDLPIVFRPWQKVPANTRAEKTLKEIAKYLKDPACECVIHAGDPDDEGQLIVDEILEYLGWQGKTYRVFVNDNIDKNILRAFEVMVDNDTCVNLGRAAYARSLADFCFGINESRLASIKTKSKILLGRVQTPTLGLIAKRDYEIENYIKSKFYELKAEASTSSGTVALNFKPNKEFLTQAPQGAAYVARRELLEPIAVDIKDKTYTLQVEQTTTQEAAPLVFNLQTLQSYISDKYKFSAAKTLTLTQELRDNFKAITYNRTDCEYLKSEHFEEAGAVLSAACKNLDLNLELDFTIRSRAFNDKNVSAHHGIIPQEVRINTKDMSQDQLKVYRAIVERYAMQFVRPAEYLIATAQVAVLGGALEYKEKRLVDAGFKALFEEVKPDSTDDLLSTGDTTITVVNTTIIEKERQPKKPYTEGSLLRDMASIAKYVQDDDVAKALKDKDAGKKGEHGGIGTPATRAEIIEELKRKEYVEVVKGKLRITDAGKHLIATIPPDMAEPDMTAHWFKIQSAIQEGKADAYALVDSVLENFERHKNNQSLYADSVNPDYEVVGTCPNCGKKLILKPQGKTYQCESNRWKMDKKEFTLAEGCGFTFPAYVWETNKRITPQELTQLLDTGETPTLTYRVYKDGRRFVFSSPNKRKKRK